MNKQNNEMIGRMTECLDCGYKAITWDRIICSKCEGILEVIASTDKKEFKK